MAIDIDESIRELTKWRKELNYDNGDYCYGGDITRYSLDVAIDTMRKYKQIEQLIADYEEYKWDRIEVSNIRRILDGDDD